VVELCITRLSLCKRSMIDVSQQITSNRGM
jgi:hypothetical protein